MISFCISSIDMSNGEYKDIYLGRTYKDLDIFLEKLNNSVNDDTVIYIHNFDYEYSFFKNNLNFFKKYYNKDDLRTFLFISQNSPLYIKLSNLVFKCSYKLLNKSINKLGEDLKIPKLDYNYDKVRTPLTKLSDEEIKYNFRDVEIMLKSIYNLYHNNPYMSKIEDIPLTKTGISRLNCLKNKEVNKKYKTKTKQLDKNGRSKGYRTRDIYNFHCNICNKEKAKTEEQLRLWEKCFQGGLTFSIPKYCGTVLNNIASIDFSSSYPTQILYRYFPYDFHIYTKDDKLNKLLFFIKTEFYMDMQLIMDRPFGTYFNTTCVLRNIKNKYSFHPLSISKIENFDILRNGENCNFLNGKLINTDKNTNIIITLTSLDLYILTCFYDFDIVDCLYLEYTRKAKRSTEYMLNACVYNGTKKVEYKDYLKLIEESQRYRKYNNDEIKDEYFLEKINNSTDYIEQEENAKRLLQTVKSDLNALYGINAMHLLHDRWSYDIEDMDWHNVPDTFYEYNKKRCKTSYVYGMYVACFARSSLCYIVNELLKNGIEVLYTDTDSVKYFDNNSADKIVLEFNDYIKNKLENYKQLKFGVLDKECVYDNFVTLGSKYYITLTNGNIHATISVAPNATRIFQRLYNENYNNNFISMIFECYHYNCTIDKSCIKKLAHTYSNTEEYIKIYDKTVNKMYEEHVISGCVLMDTSVQMRSFESKIWREYGEIIKLLYNDTVNMASFDLITKITYDKNKDVFIVESEV